MKEKEDSNDSLETPIREQSSISDATPEFRIELKVGKRLFVLSRIKISVIVGALFTIGISILTYILGK